jgi:large subunit ribosomal protein L7A
MVLSKSVWKLEGGVIVPVSGLLSAKKKSVGTKQTIKALEKGFAKKVFIASDAEQHVVKSLIRDCREKGIPVIVVDSMKDLGKACGIEVGCASVALIEE